MLEWLSLTVAWTLLTVLDLALTRAVCSVFHFVVCLLKEAQLLQLSERSLPTQRLPIAYR